jgi:GT2 family glycosyltransferase
MQVSVIIPTYNRLQELQRVVAALQSQTVPLGTELEIVIVDDGSGDRTWEWLRDQPGETGIVALRQANSGPAAARNRGVEAAGGDIVIFLGDDTVPQPGWLVAHVEEHRLFGRSGPVATIGYTSFPPETDSPFLRFINEYGAQFGYLIIEDPGSVPFNFFYTSNVSLPRSELERLRGFREDFPAAAWEDIEFAYRATASGLRIRYQPKARTIHHHCVQPRTFCRRQRTSGHSAAILAGLHPELEGLLGVARLGRPMAVRRIHRLFLGLLVEVGERTEGVVPARVYQSFLDQCYLIGLAEGLHSS